MSRFASAFLLLGGAALLIAIQVSPATSAPRRDSATPVSASDQIAPQLSDVNAEVARLRERLATPPPAPRPTRDPFSFGAARVPAPAPMSVVDTRPVVAPAPVLPRLVAVLSAPADGGVLRTAVFSVGDDLEFVTPGGKIGGFVVRSIAPDVVTLVDPASGASYRVQ